MLLIVIYLTRLSIQWKITNDKNYDSREIRVIGSTSAKIDEDVGGINPVKCVFN